MRSDYLFVNTIPPDQAQTHQSVTQYVMSTEMADQLPAVIAVLKSHVRKVQNYKAICFFTTARQCALMAELAIKMGKATLSKRSWMRCLFVHIH